MKLPNGESAQVDLAKIEGYLLSETHPVGRAKARFFRSLGFRLEDAEALREELLRIAVEGEAEAVHGPFATKYVVSGVVAGRLRVAPVRTVWIVQGERPRLVTAYPE